MKKYEPVATLPRWNMPCRQPCTIVNFALSKCQPYAIHIYEAGRGTIPAEYIVVIHATRNPGGFTTGTAPGRPGRKKSGAG